MDCWRNLKLFEEQSTEFSEPKPFFIRCGKLEDSAWDHRPNIQDYIGTYNLMLVDCPSFLLIN